MTYEELKAEAYSMGYTLVKIGTPRTKSCLCGSSSIEPEYSYLSEEDRYLMRLRCQACGRKGPYARTTRRMVELWNSEN